MTKSFWRDKKNGIGTGTGSAVGSPEDSHHSQRKKKQPNRDRRVQAKLKAMDQGQGGVSAPEVKKNEFGQEIAIVPNV